MIGVPIANQRDRVIANLNSQLDRYFGASSTMQEIAADVTSRRLDGRGWPTSVDCHRSCEMDSHGNEAR